MKVGVWIPNCRHLATAERRTPEMRIVKLEVTPRAPDDLVPRLMPRPIDQVPGDAAPTPTLDTGFSPPSEAWRRLVVHRGRVRIGSLAADLGWSRRHLGHHFREEIGLTP